MLRLALLDEVNTLDLRTGLDWARYAEVFAPLIGTPDIDVMARRSKIDGVYDRSNGGIAIYNALPIQGIRNEPGSEPVSHPRSIDTPDCT